jgi:hypothetical protein
MRDMKVDEAEAGEVSHGGLKRTEEIEGRRF